MIAKLLDRKRILSAVRGVTAFAPATENVSRRGLRPINGDREPLKEREAGRAWKCFPLHSHHIGCLVKSGRQNKSTEDAAQSQQTPRQIPKPSDFHATLCGKIRNAKHRIYLASLYVGPAADPIKCPKETEFLQSLEYAASKGRNESAIEIKILLDQNRALRQVPISRGSNDNSTGTVTSAQACRRALQESSSGEIYLLSVLPDFWQTILPNPINEAAGVFHIKAYVVDDNLILTGANLSEEYYSERHDRYLYIKNNALVECYAQLIQVLCRHGAQLYQDPMSAHAVDATSSRDREALMESVAQVLTDPVEKAIDPDTSKAAGEPIAYAVPTFQAPPVFFAQASSSPMLVRSDAETVVDWVRATAATMAHQQGTTMSCTLRMVSAYLNPTPRLIQTCRDEANLTAVHLLTAGRVSHGFKPSPKAGNKGRDWIPTIFDITARKAASLIRNLNGESTKNTKCWLWFYQRESWTFHAKGLWVTCRSTPSINHNAEPGPRIDKQEEQLLGVTYGSGNYGARSEYRDMESNVILLFPSTLRNNSKELERYHVDEFNSMCQWAVPPSQEVAHQLPWHLRLIFPWIRSFF